MPDAGTRAIVNFGEVEPDDLNAAYNADADAESVWTDYQINSRYEEDRHIYMTGITAPGGVGGGSPGLGATSVGVTRGAAFVQLASPTLLWVADWTAARFKAIPSIPEFEVAPNSGWVLMDVHVEPGMLVVGADGVTPLYRISGTYVYGHKNPSARIIYQVNFTRPPWLEDRFQRTLSETGMERGLIDIVQQAF